MDISAEKKRQLRAVYRISFNNGKRRFAVVFDAVFIWAIILLSLRIALIPRIKASAPAWCAAAFLTAALFLLWRLIDRERFTRHKLKLRVEAKAAAAKRKAERSPERLYSLIEPERGVAVIRKTDLLTADDIVAAIRENGLPVKIVTLAEPTEKAKGMIAGSNDYITLLTPQEHTGTELDELYPVTENETDDEIISSHASLIERRSFKEIFLAVSRQRAVKYLLVGGGLFLFSFVMGRRLYYRMLAALSAGAGSIMLAIEAAGNAAAEKKKPV